MSYIYIFYILGVLYSISVIFSVVKRLLRDGCRKLYLSTASLVIIGTVAGIWLGGFFEYQASDRLRIVGFPFPVAVFVLEDSGWTDFVMSSLMMFVMVAFNMAILVSTLLVPVLFFPWRRMLTPPDKAQVPTGRKEGEG